ncbi:hypothetical protein ARSEF1564_005210 [Beauveria bassiana]
MKSIPIVLAGLAALAAAETTSDKRATGPLTKEELCVGPNRDIRLWLRDLEGCSNEIRAKEGFTMEKVLDCVNARVSSRCRSAASAAAAPTTTPKDEPAPPQNGIADVEGKPTKEELCGRLPSVYSSAAPPATTPTTPKDKPTPPQNGIADVEGKPPTKEELCVSFNGDYDTCQREFEYCLNEIPDRKEGRLPSVHSSAAPPATTPTTPKDKPTPPQNGIADVKGKPPTKEELCVSFNGDYDTCQREFEYCLNEITDRKEGFPWDKISKCLQGRLPSVHSSAAPPATTPTTPKDKPTPPQNGIADVEGKPLTKEELCVGFNGDYDTCQREFIHCFNEIPARKEGFPWDKVSKCLQGRLPSAA